MNAHSCWSRGVVPVAAAGLASIGLGCHTVHGAGPHPFADLLAEALLGPEWAYWHDHAHASEPHPSSCDGGHDPDGGEDWEDWEDWEDGACPPEDDGDDAYPEDDGDDAYPEDDGDDAYGDPALPDVLFEEGSAELTPDARADLRWLAELVRDERDVEILLLGHSDGSGDEGFDLSDERARSVGEFLAAEGVPSRRIAWVGLGDSRPVAASDSAEGRWRNRRVEIVLRRREPDPYS
jgi:outer membrane protein OmpA-like peptidoglycan-associated protein